MRFGFMLLITALLLGCSTAAEDRKRHVETEVGNMIAVFGPACERLGFARATDPWRQCILRLSARDDYSTTPAAEPCAGHSGFYTCGAD